jgi:lipopolysaccharide transport system permease protein
MPDQENNLPALATVERVIKPRSGLIAIDFVELWRYRELFVFMAWRDILVRYKQTLLGIAWAVVQPLAIAAIMTFVFGYVGGKAKENGVTIFQYSVMCMAGTVPWNFFANAMRESSNSLIANAQMIAKIYFPRLIVPSAAILSGTVDFLIGAVLLGLMIAIAGVTPEVKLLLLPLFFSVGFFAAFAIGLWFSALNVKYRDVKYVIPFVVQMGMMITPVGFPTKAVPEHLQFWYNLNPMVGVIDGFRWCILGPSYEPYWPGFGAAVGLVFVLLITGAMFFRSSEKNFADVI